MSVVAGLPTASFLLTLATAGNGDDPSSILSKETMDMIKDITLENVVRPDKGREHPRSSNRGSGNTRYEDKSGHRGKPRDRGQRGVVRVGSMSRPSSGHGWKKPSASFKPKPKSFDDAMKQKIVADLNKITPQNYDTILKSLQAICSRLSDDEHPWALRLILENATHQHIFAQTYVNLYKDIASSRPKDIETANDILNEFMTGHMDAILTSIDNGDNYDEFCSANKMKTQLIGHSIVLGEAANMGIIPLKNLGPHAVELVGVLEKVIDRAGNKESPPPKETTENGVKCVTEFFKTLSKTKADKDGFQNCIKMTGKILEKESGEKKLTPKARFALMDFQDEMKKTIASVEKAKTVYRPGMFKATVSYSSVTIVKH